MGVNIHIFEILNNSVFTKITKHPEPKRPNVPDREKATAQEQEGTCVLEVLEVRDNRSREQAEKLISDSRRDTFFIITKGKTEYKILKPLISYLF